MKTSIVSFNPSPRAESYVRALLTRIGVIAFLQLLPAFLPVLRGAAHATEILFQDTQVQATYPQVSGSPT